MNDRLIKGQFKGLDIAFVWALTSRTAEEAVLRHDCDPAAAHLLSRGLTGALLAAALLPDENHRLTVSWQYPGALRRLVADAGADGTVRAYIEPPHLSDTADKNELYGDTGEVRVDRFAPDGHLLSSGTTPVGFHDIIEDLAYHFCISDQVETAAAVMVGFKPDPEHPVDLCQGWLIQALPGCDLERFDRVRSRMHQADFRSLLARHGEADEKGYFERIAAPLVEGEADFRGLHFEELPAPRFRCSCDHPDVLRAVAKSLPPDQRKEILDSGDPLVFRCRFCNARREIPAEECRAIWEEESPGETEDGGEA